MYSTALWEHIESEKHADRERKRLKLLHEVKTKIKAHFSGLSVQNVYITGSLTRPGQFYPGSDIDIAVEKMPEDAYFKSIHHLETVLGHPVEIIELELCRFADKIRSTGVKIL
jgi:uncharacterized protein